MENYTVNIEGVEYFNWANFKLIFATPVSLLTSNRDDHLIAVL